MKNLLLTIVISAIGVSSSVAQNIGYADINAILSVMPENEKIGEDLQIYATGLQKRLDDTKQKLDAIVSEFNKVLSAGDTAKALEFQKQGLELDKQLQQGSAAAEQQLAQKRGELLQPVLQRIRTAMGAVAKRKGFEYVMNSVDGSGTSIVLWGPDGHDITRDVVDELGIKLEGQGGDAQPSPAPVQDAGKKKK